MRKEMAGVVCSNAVAGLHDMSKENIDKLKVLANQLVQFADDAEQRSNDDRCFMLYGLTRDCAYRILAEADKAGQHAEARRARGEKRQQGKELGW